MNCRVFGLLCVATLAGCSASALAQDSRPVEEPVFPVVCTVYHAPLRSTPAGPVVGPTQEEQDTESYNETNKLQEALHNCRAEQAVELALGSNSSYNSFLIYPITLPPHVSLVIDGGVTVFGSRDPTKYQDKSDATCGLIGEYKVDEGCRDLISMDFDSGVYGYGVIDGQGDKTLIGGENAGKTTWWGLTTFKKHSGKNGKCLQPGEDETAENEPPVTEHKGCEQASPNIIAGGVVKKGFNRELTLYKITIRNPPFHTVRLGGSDVTVWGVKIQAPWNLPNTDGFDVSASNVTISHTTVANGDQEIAFASGDTPLKNVTVDYFNGYNKGGITILGSGDAVSDLLIQNVNITGDLPIVQGTTVNGVSEATMKATYKLRGFYQALPNATGDLKAIQIENDATKYAGPGPQISTVTYNSVCVSDIVKPINLIFSAPVTHESVQNLLLEDIHVLAPSPQLVAVEKSQLLGQGKYDIFIDGNPEYRNQIALNNVVLDDLGPEHNSIETLSAIGNKFKTETNVYPSLLKKLAATAPIKGTIDGTKVDLQANEYASATEVSSAALARACHRLPFLDGELYLSNGSNAVGERTNLKSASIGLGSEVTLNAMVQPIMSQTTLFIENSYNNDPGLLAIGSPALTNRINFYDGWKFVGSAVLSANGTLATLRLQNLAAGTHIFRAEYPKDRYYDSLVFGSVMVISEP